MSYFKRKIERWQKICNRTSSLCLVAVNLNVRTCLSVCSCHQLNNVFTARYIIKVDGRQKEGRMRLTFHSWYVRYIKTKARCSAKCTVVFRVHVTTFAWLGFLAVSFCFLFPEQRCRSIAAASLIFRRKVGFVKGNLI